MSAWGWDASACGASACGTAGEREKAMAGAEAWLREHPGGTARVGRVRFSFSTADLSASWDPRALTERSRRLPGGGIAWERVPPWPVAAVAS